MRYLLFAVALLSLCATLVAAQQDPLFCDITQNHGPQGMLVYNTECTDVEYPYCTGAGLCSECSTGKPCSTCDCPANFECVQPQFNPIRNAAFCAPLDPTMYDRVCTSDSDCAVMMNNENTGQPDIAMQGVCVSGACKFCNRLAEVTRVCQQIEATNDQNSCDRGSKAEGRACLATDVWNSNTWPLASALPTDPYAYEASQWSSLRPCESRTPSPDPTAGSTTSGASTGVVSCLAFLCVTLSVLQMFYVFYH